MWVSLAEAVNTTKNELGCEVFSTFTISQGSGQLSNTVESATLDWTGSGDLRDTLSINDLVVIGYVNYKVVSLTASTVTIDIPITLTASDWNYVKVANQQPYLLGYNKRERALQTAYRTLLPITCTPEDPIQQELKDANSFLGCYYYQNPTKIPMNFNQSNISSKRIGDLSYSYNLDKSVEPIPDFIIAILGSCYIGGVRPAFFTK